MPDQKRGNDAADHAPKPKLNDSQRPKEVKQDAPNYKERTDDGGAMEREDVSSANDE